MKKITAFLTALVICVLSGASALAYNFPEPDWGALLAEKTAMVKETDFELYVEGREGGAVNYGAKLEPAKGVYIGMAADYAQSFLPLGSYLTYIQSFSQPDLTHPSNEMIRSDDAVAMIGWTVNSLDDVNFDVMRKVLDTLNSYNKPMFIRFANEMNVSALGDDPDRYVQIFRQAANMIHEYPNFAVVWAPNDMGALDRPFNYYYPGDEYVDWVGVSCYTTKYFQGNPNTAEKDAIYFMTGQYGWPTNKLKPIMDFMKKNNINKPVMISEGGVARSDSNGEDYAGWHEPRLRNMLWNVIMKYPQVKMINYFNVPRNEFQNYVIEDRPESVQIFKEAADSGAYMRSASKPADFVFKPANDGGTLAANSEGIVNLYTLAYFANSPDISVNYRLDGQWFHSSDKIPYICRLNINNISDGAHKFSIDSNGASKEYTLYKKGSCISFGKEPSGSAPAPSENTAGSAQSSAEITVLLNGQPIQFPDQAPIIIEGRTLVPLRAIFEAMKASVNWDQNTQTVTAVRGDTTIKLSIGNNKLYKNGQAVTLDVPAQIISDRTMVPARAVAESFGAEVGWDGNTRTVTITE